MRHSGPIVDYLDALARELGFDIALSRRVCAEIEDHLWQATDGCLSTESQQQAIAHFGSPRDIARQYMAASLLTQIRWVGLAMIGVSTAIFLAMKARVVWYAVMQWKLTVEWEPVQAIALAIDRCDFIVVTSIALIGWIYISTRRAPIRMHVTYNKELKRCIFLCGAVSGGLILSVLIETFLTGIRLRDAGWSSAAVVPILSLVVEMIAAALLVFHICAMIRRTALVSSLLLAEDRAPLRETAAT